MPLTTTRPVPFGARSKSALDEVTISCPFVSRLAARPVLKFNVVPDIVLNAPVLAEFAPIAVPSIEPEFMSMPVTGVVPSSRSSIESKLLLILVPHVSS